MIVRALDSNGDWTFGRGQAGYLTGQKAIEQNIRCRCLSWYGDCFFALQEGVHWDERLDIGQTDQLNQELKAVILQSYGVVGVEQVSFEYESASRFVSVTYDATTIYSQSFLSLLETAGG
jgi:hypothetical protein